MKADITIDGVTYTEDEAIRLATESWPFKVGVPTVSDAVFMLRTVGHAVVQAPPRHVIGIDNGVSGAVAILSRSSGSIVDLFTMPTRKRGKNEVDVVEFCKRINAYSGFTNGVFAVEEPCGSKSLNAAKSMASSFHALRGAIEAMGGVFIAVPVREWQKEMLGKTKGDSKPLALAAAKAIWPEEQWLATPRCKVAHDGMVDAALIAEYTRRK